MDTWDEIDQIRAELARVNQSVNRLTRRLDELEAQQAPKMEIAAKRVQHHEVPPPLPASAFRQVEAPAAPKVEAPPLKPATPIVPPPVPKPSAPPQIKKPRRFGPPEGMGLEMAVTTYWIPRFGILLLALGTVWFFTYVSNQFHDAPWMPFARVALGYALALGLGGIGWVLEKKYAAYARLLMGGGFGLLYFVTFATWYIPQTRISPSQEVTLFFLGLLVFAWGAVAQWRKSPLIALSMALLGHFTVALSTLSLESPSRAAVGGLLVLGIGSAWFLVRNGWYAVAMSAMIGSYLNQFFWLQQSPSSGAPLDFALGIAVLAIYLVLYAVADRLTPLAHSTGHTRLRNVYCGLNTGGFLLLGLALMQGFAFTRGEEHLLYFALALFSGAMGWSYATREIHADDHYTPAWTAGGNIRATGDLARDPLSSIYFTKGSALLTAGIAVLLDGPAVTLSIALQALALLIAARQSGRPVGRLLSLGTAGIAFLHGGYTLFDSAPPAMGEAGFTGYAVVALLIAAVYWGIAELYRVTPWHTFATTPYAGPAMFRELARDLEISPAASDTAPLPSRMIFSHLLVAFGALLLVGNVEALLPLFHFAPVVTLLALVAAGIGLARRSAPILAGGLFFSAVGVYGWLGQLYGGYERETQTLAMAAACLVPLLGISELYRLVLPRRFDLFEKDGGIQGAWFRNRDLMAQILSVAAVLVLVTGLAERAETSMALLIAGAAALATTAYAFAGTAPNFGLAGVLLVLGTSLFSPQRGLESLDPTLPVLGVLLAALATVAGETRGWWGNCPGLIFHRLLPAPYLLYGAFAWNIIWLADAYFPESAVPIVLSVAAVGFALAMPWLHARAMASLATALVVVALAVWHEDTGGGVTTLWHYSTVIIVAVSLAGDRYISQQKPFALPWPGRVMLVCAWVACTTYNAELFREGWHYTGLAMIAIAFLVYAGLFRTRTAAALSLITGAIATLPLMANASPGIALDPLLAAYISLVLYWIGAERGAAMVIRRAPLTLEPGQMTALSLALTGIPTLLGVLCLARVEIIQNFYLTMGWTAWGLVIFCWALFTRQPWFRYMGLATFALALSRAFLVDIWRLGGLYRVGAMLFLGVALLAVAYGYTRWRAKQEEES